jgi:hypothetical protein
MPYKVIIDKEDGVGRLYYYTDEENPVTTCHCSGCLKWHDPEDCPYRYAKEDK